MINAPITGEYSEEYFKSDRDQKTTSRRNVEMLKIVSPHPEDVILDAGCGTGEMLQLCSQYGSRIVGLDSATVAAKEAKLRTNDDVEVVVGVCESLPFKSSVFNKIISEDVVEHLLPNRLEAFLSESYRILSGTGLIFIHTWPSRWSIRTFVKYSARSLRKHTSDMSRWDHFHVNLQSPFSITRSLRMGGFSPLVSTRQRGNSVLVNFPLLGKIDLLPILARIPFGKLLYSDIWAVGKKRRLSVPS